MVFGRLPNLPTSDDDTDPDSNDQAALAFQLQDKLRYLHDLAKENIDAQKQNTKERYDKKTRPIYLKAGDMVLLKNFHRETKLSPRYVGPYPIVRATSHNVDLLINDTVKTHHLQHVKPSAKKIATLSAVLTFLLLLSIAIATPVVQRYDNKAGLIFQQIGDGLSKTGEWNLIASINLTDIKTKISKLWEIENKIEELTKLPQEKIFRNSYTEILKLLRNNCQHVNSAFLEFETSAERSKRRKRELFRAGSSLLKFLYGTPDADDADFFNKKLEELSSSQKAAEELAMNHIKITQKSINIVERNLGKVSENFEKINETLFLLQPVVSMIKEGISTATFESSTVKLIELFHELYSITWNEIGLLQNGILFAKSHIVHPHIFNQERLKQTIKDIKLPMDSHWVSDIETSFPTIMDSCKIDAYSLKNQVLFILKVPVVSLTTLRGYHLLPYPVLLTNSSYFYIRPTEPFIFLDDLHTTHVFLPSLSPSCELIKPQLFLCTFPYLHRDTRHICEAELLSHNTNNCVPKIARFTASVYHKVSDNQWIFLLAKEDNILIRSPNAVPKTNTFRHPEF